MSVFNISNLPILIVSAGDPKTLIVNKSTKYTVNIGDTNGVGVGNGLGITPLGPYESIVVDGDADVWCIEAVGGQPCTVITQQNALLWTPKAVQPNIVDPASPVNVSKAANSSFSLINPPPGVQGVAILLSNTINITSVTVVGKTSGYQYGTYVPGANPNGTQTWIPLLGDQEPGGFQFNFTASGGIGSTPVGIVWLMNNFAAGLMPDGNTASVQLGNVNTVSNALLVSADPTLYANQSPAVFSALITAGNSATLLAAVPGKTILMRSAYITVNNEGTANATMQLLSSSSLTVLADIYVPGISGPVIFDGSMVPPGEGILIKNTSAGTILPRTILAYSLQ